MGAPPPQTPSSSPSPMAAPPPLRLGTCCSDRYLAMPPGKLPPTVPNTSLGPPEPSRAITLQEPSCYKACTTLTESGYCGIQYKESTGQTPDTFDFFPDSATNAESSAGGCPVSFVYIPNLSSDGVSALGIPSSTESFISVSCGQVLGLDGTAVSLALTTRAQPFIVGVYTDTTTALTAPTTGFSLDYTQVPC